MDVLTWLVIPTGKPKGMGLRHPILITTALVEVMALAQRALIIQVS
jgi:hypothetical protein